MEGLFVDTEVEKKKEEIVTEEKIVEEKAQEKASENLTQTAMPEKKTEKAPQLLEKIEVSSAPEYSDAQKEYYDSFENLTVADIKKQEEEKKLAEFEKEKQALIEAQYDKQEPEPQSQPAQTTVQKQEVSQNIIEKPNYDFLEESKRVVRLKKREKKKPSKKLAAIVLACALGASAIICIANTAALDQMNSNFVEVEEQYNVNLRQYLQNIANLDSTKKSMEMLETYPEDLLPAGDLGQKSNWFDRFCNFIVGLFGG